MKRGQRILLIDGAINLILGVLLIPFPAPVVRLLGVPAADLPFYPSILGGVLFGIGIALIIEYRRNSEKPAGLGLRGAVAINLCGGLVLAAHLLTGNLGIPLRGILFLWGLVFVLIGISGLEILLYPNYRKPEGRF